MDYKKKIVILLLFCFLIRLIGVNQSMWLDEAISANVARMPRLEIIKNFSTKDFHPPVYYWFLNIWIKIFGSGVMAMRMSSVLFSIIVVWLVYKIGKEIKDEKAGFWAALLVGVNPLLIYYSQELRMYMMVTMWLVGALYFFVKITKKVDWKNILGFNLFCFLSFVTFYGSVFFVAAMLLYLLVGKKFKLYWINSIGIILAIGVIGPLLLVQLKNSSNMLIQVVNWSLVLGKVTLKNLLLIPLKFSVGKIDWYPKIFYYAVAGIWTVIVFGLAVKEMIKNKMLRFLLIVPIVEGIVFSLKSPLLDYFRFLYLIPVLALLLANLKNAKIKLALTLGFLIFSGIYLLDPNMYREDWKSLAADLDTKQNVYMIESFGDPIKYYNPEIKIKDIKTVEPTENEITIIPFGAAIHGIDFGGKLQKLGYHRIFEKSYRENKLEKWVK